LLRAEKVALRRGEIAVRWTAAHPKPTDVRIGQVLASLHEMGLVVRIKQPARGGSDVAFYRLSQLGRELCERLHVPSSVPAQLLTNKVFYARLKEALRLQTMEPLYLTTFDDLDEPGSALEFHQDLMARLSEIRRPVHWIFVGSVFFDQHVRPSVLVSDGKVHLYRRETVMAREPTMQVLDSGSFVYPVAPRTALATSRDVGHQTWLQHKAASSVVN
jgi:DNA-binding PadR family transcriptional regulator